MESAPITPTAEEIADLVVQRLIAGGGIPDLANANMMTIEERIDAYTQASIPEQQHGQNDDAPANSWNGRVAVIQCDGGRVQVRDDLWGDGLKVNWSLWATHFSHYTPITDLMHALSYVYAAAVASRGQIEEGWSLYLVWLDWVWAGDVRRVIAERRQIASAQEEVPERLAGRSPI